MAKNTNLTFNADNSVEKTHLSKNNIYNFTAQ